tara:strand:- start:552 stop:875 length:324 start_codon:yes stop_codon:yes gene_type:complete
MNNLDKEIQQKRKLAENQRIKERKDKIKSATAKQLDVLLGDSAFFTVNEVAKYGKCSISKVYKMSIREGQENRTGGYRMKFFYNKANKLVTSRDDVLAFLDYSGYVD